MISKYSPGAPGAIQAKLQHLRNRRQALDELILSMERYSVYELPHPRRPAGVERRKRVVDSSSRQINAA
jgi:hypothetical protein